VNTGDWRLGPTEDDLGLLWWRIGVWNHLGYANPPTPDCNTIPPLGQRSAEAIKGAHDAIEVIDQLIRRLNLLRGQIEAELREDAAAKRTREGRQ
jgi:hypothetical protein